jgi:hypothetical protein
MRLIIHPGHAKCASTSIQDNLFGNHVLLSSAGHYLVNDDLLINHNNNPSWKPVPPVKIFSRLLDGLLNFTYFETHLIALESIATQINANSVIITSEVLCRTNNAEIKRIHESLSTIFDDIQVVYYVRWPDELAISSWEQWRHKEGASLAASINEFVKQPLAASMLEVADYLASNYGQLSLTVRGLFDPRYKTIDIIDDFCELLGLPQLRHCSLISNQRMNLEFAEVLARIQTIYKDKDDISVKQALEHFQAGQMLLYGRTASRAEYEQRLCIHMDYDIIMESLFSNYMNSLDYKNLRSAHFELIKSLPQSTPIQVSLEYTAFNLGLLVDLQKRLINLENSTLGLLRAWQLLSGFYRLSTNLLQEITQYLQSIRSRLPI